MEELIFSSKSLRRDSVRKLVINLDPKQRELKLVGRKGDFRKKLVKVDDRWKLEFEYVPSYVYLLFLREMQESEERIFKRKNNTI